tara:strand:+ start:307 stop:681 length:375 start_codon:yes stop_codon:yes gene_type:complete
MESDSNEFGKNCKDSLRDIVLNKTSNHHLNFVESIFKAEKKIHIKEEMNDDVLSLLNTCKNQNSNISVILEDNTEVILKPHDTRQIFKVFDRLNENNQVKLINNLIKSRTNFTNTINFCNKIRN